MAQRLEEDKEIPAGVCRNVSLRVLSAEILLRFREGAPPLRRGEGRRNDRKTSRVSFPLADNMLQH